MKKEGAVIFKVLKTVTMQLSIQIFLANKISHFMLKY